MLLLLLLLLLLQLLLLLLVGGLLACCFDAPALYNPASDLRRRFRGEACVRCADDGRKGTILKMRATFLVAARRGSRFGSMLAR